AAQSRLDRASRLLDLFVQVVERGGDLRRIDLLHTAARFGQVGDRLRERRKRRDLGQRLALQLLLLQFVIEAPLEEQVIHLAVLAERIEVEFGKRGEPVGIELLEARPPRRRYFDRVRARQAAEIRDVALNQAAQLARRRIEVFQIGG